MAELWTLAQGLGDSWTVTVRDDDGNPFTRYTGSEALAGSVRAGRDSAPLVTLAPAWLAPAQGTLVVAIAGSSTTAMDPGRYLVQVKLADGSADLYEGFLEVTYSPGSAAALPSYGSFADMLDKASWVEKLQRPTDLAGFARQRYAARKWFEDLLHRHYRGDCGFSTDSTFGAWMFGRLGWYRDGRRSADLQGWLDADGLDVTQQVIDAVTYHAIALICDRQVSPAKEDNGYAAAAVKFFARAEDAASLITAEVDTNADGRNDITIRLGLADTLEG